MSFNAFAKVLLSASVALLLAGCGGGGGGSSSSGGETNALTRHDLTAVSDASGIVQFSVAIADGVGSVQLNAQSTGNALQLISLTGPNGDMLGMTVTESSSALLKQSEINAFNFPTLTHSVTPGTYTARYQTYAGGSSETAGTSVTLSVITRAALSSGGVLPVNIVFVGPAGGSDDTTKAIQGAVQYWQETYAKANITLDVQYYTFDGPRLLTDPRVGDPLYTQISSSTRPYALNMLIGVDVSGTSGDADEDFGITGSIPGSLVPGPHSVAAMSIIKTAGNDGRYNYDGVGATQIFNDEIDIAGEALSLLAGEYLGLLPVVQFNGDDVIASDRLPDTQSCVTLTDCYDNKDARENFMFPRVLFEDNYSGRSFARTEVTPDQTALMLQSPITQ